MDRKSEEHIVFIIRGNSQSFFRVIPDNTVSQEMFTLINASEREEARILQKQQEIAVVLFWLSWFKSIYASDKRNSRLKTM